MGQFITVKRTEKFTFLQPSHTFYPLHVLPPLAEFPVVTNDFFARLRPLCSEKWRAHSNRLEHRTTSQQLALAMPQLRVHNFFFHLLKVCFEKIIGTSSSRVQKNKNNEQVQLEINNSQYKIHLHVLVKNPFCHFWRDKRYFCCKQQSGTKRFCMLPSSPKKTIMSSINQKLKRLIKI